jgi:two-component sensor histidine kinase
MAVIHESLYQSEDLTEIDVAEYIRSLAAHLLSTYGGYSQGIRLTTNVADMVLSVDVAMYIGLIIHEIVSNSFKHAFPSDREGQIKVDLSQADDDQILLSVSDDGIGLSPDVEPGQTSSVGLELVVLLTQQLGGKLQIDRSDGTTYEIVFSR